MMRSVRSSLTIGRLAIQPKTTNIRAGKSNIFIYLQKKKYYFPKTKKCLEWVPRLSHICVCRETIKIKKFMRKVPVVIYF